MWTAAAAASTHTLCNNNKAATTKQLDEKVEGERRNTKQQHKNAHTKNMYEEGEQTKEINGMCKLLFLLETNTRCRYERIWNDRVLLALFYVLNHILHGRSSYCCFCRIPAAAAARAATTTTAISAGELWQIEMNANPSIIWHFYCKHTENVLKFQRIERRKKNDSDKLVVFSTVVCVCRRIVCVREWEREVGWMDGWMDVGTHKNIPLPI